MRKPLLALTLGFLLVSQAAFSATIYVLSGTNLNSINSANPSIVVTGPAITGIAVGETLVGIDIRPQTQSLYGLGVDATNNRATLYHITPENGFAAAVGTTTGLINFTTDGVTVVDLPDSASVGYGFDFNPLADRIRVVAGSVNFRVDPNTGLPVDGNNGGVVTAGTNPDGSINTGTITVDAAAYTNNAPNTTITTLYTLDASSNSLFIQSNPNGGSQTSGQAITLGGNTLDFLSVNAFDIPAGVSANGNNAPVLFGSGFAIFNVGGTTGLYSINLVNGQATLIGNVGNGTTAVQGMAIRNNLGGGPAIALNSAGTQVVRFNTSVPGTSTSVAVVVASLAAGESLVGIDWRPQTGQLYGFAVNATNNTASLYLLDPQNGALTVVGAQNGIANVALDFPDPTTSAYGVDFNPAVDRLRLTTSTGLNFRVNPDTGALVLVDGVINGDGSVGVDEVAYTNNFGRALPSAVPTVLYTIDVNQDKLYIQTPPNNGTQSSPVALTSGGTTLALERVRGFDIPSSNAANPEAWFVGTVGGVDSIYQLNLTTGVATSVGVASVALRGLVVFTTPIIDFTPFTGPTNFGSIAFGTTTTRTLSVSSGGSQLVSYNSSASGLFSVTSGASGTLGSATITITLTGSAVGAATGQLTVTSSDPSMATRVFALNGTVTAVAPTVTSPTSAAITTNSATLGGNVTSSGGVALTERGIVYALTSANGDPVIGGTGVTKVVAAGLTDGVFTAPATGLTANTGYSFKAYAINSVGTSYTSVAAFTTLANPTPPNVAPVITSGPTATPSTAGVGQTVAFSVAATDADSNPLTFTWTIAGTTVTGANPTFVFTAAGVFTVTVNVTDGFGGSATGSVVVTVVNPVIGTGNDSDGDGFSDAFEIAASTNPNLASSSPSGGGPIVIADLVQSKLIINFNFGKPASDSIAFSGTLPIVAGFNAANKIVVVDVGGVIKSIQLDAKGKSPKGDATFKLSFKNKKGVVAAQTGKFLVRLSKGDFDAQLADEGLVNATVKKINANVLVRVIFNGTVYQHLQAVTYTAKAGKNGIAKAVR